MLVVFRRVVLAAIILLLVAWGALFLVLRDPQGRPAMLLAQFAVLVGWHVVPVPGGGPGLPQGLAIGGPFHLVDMHGHQASDRDFRGRFMLVYFGYTYCPDICPTTLQTISAALDILGPKAANIAPVFITVDPGRDDPAKLAQYLALFDTRLIGLTGSSAEIAQVAQEYRVSFTVSGDPHSGSYLVNHTSLLMLMAPDGTFRALYSSNIPATELADALAKQL